MSVTMGNAIRELKLEISNSDIDLPEQDVGHKNETCRLMNLKHHFRRKMLYVIKLTITSGIESLLPERSFKILPERRSRTGMLSLHTQGNHPRIFKDLDSSQPPTSDLRLLSACFLTQSERAEISL
jgi:hypothetical protein